VYVAFEDNQWTGRRQQQQQRVRFVDLRNCDQRSVGRRGPRHCRLRHHPRDDRRQAPPPSTTTTATSTSPTTATTTTEKVRRPDQELRQLARAGYERVSAQVFQGQHGVTGQAVGPRTG